jgi:tetratricopeptide (TPR) repeat protein
LDIDVEAAVKRLRDPGKRPKAELDEGSGARYLAAWSLERAGKTSAAVERYRELLASFDGQVKPPHYDELARLGIAEIELTRARAEPSDGAAHLREAKKAYLRIAEFDNPTSPAASVALFRLGRLAAAAGDHDAAVSHFWKQANHAGYLNLLSRRHVPHAVAPSDELARVATLGACANPPP